MDDLVVEVRLDNGAYYKVIMHLFYVLLAFVSLLQFLCMNNVFPFDLSFTYVFVRLGCCLFICSLTIYPTSMRTLPYLQWQWRRHNEFLDARHQEVLLCCNCTVLSWNRWCYGPLLQTPTYIQMSEKQWTFQMDPWVRTPIVKLILVTLKVAVSVI